MGEKRVFESTINKKEKRVFESIKTNPSNISFPITAGTEVPYTGSLYGSKKSEKSAEKNVPIYTPTIEDRLTLAKAKKSVPSSTGFSADYKGVSFNPEIKVENKEAEEYLSSLKQQSYPDYMKQPFADINKRRVEAEKIDGVKQTLQERLTAPVERKTAKLTKEQIAEAQTARTKKYDDMNLERAEEHYTDYEEKTGFSKFMHLLGNSISNGIEGYALGVAKSNDLFFSNGMHNDLNNASRVEEQEAQLIRQKLELDNDKASIFVQDLVTNVAQNAIPQVMSLGTGAGVFGQAMFGLSTFGNTYGQTLEEGYNENQALAYSLATTASEVGLSSLISGIPGLGGYLSGEAASKLTRGMTSTLAKVAISRSVAAGSEFVEESSQDIISVFLRNWILGEDKKVSFSSAGYSGLLGLASSLVMGIGGIGSDVSAAKADRAYTEAGTKYKAALESIGVDINQVINVAKTTEKSGELYKVSKEISKENEVSEYDAGRLYYAAREYSESSRPIVEAAYGKAIKSRPDGINSVLTAYDKIVEAGGAFVGEIESVADSANAIRESIVNETNIDDAFLGKFALDTVMYAPRALMLGTAQKSNLDSAESEEYNNSRGDNDAAYINGGVRGSVGESNTYDSRREEETRRVREEDGEAFLRRFEADLEGAGYRVINSGNSALVYIPASADNSNGSRAVEMLASMGVNAVYCDGNIETNSKGMTAIDSQAITAPDGTVYVSSNAKLTDAQIASHEVVHVKQRYNSPEYAEFESAICENVMWGTEAYKKIANKINRAYYQSKYDVEDISFTKKFLTEITAYINEFVSTDPARAERNFALMFKDWQAVVDASKQFNKSIGADFSESASSMSAGSAFTEPDTKEIARDYTKKQWLDGMMGNVKNAKQRQLEAVAESLGVKLAWSGEVTRGKYNPVTRTVTLNPGQTLSEMYLEIFKHEFVHDLENRKDYSGFKKYLFERSIQLKEYCVRMLGEAGADVTGTREQIIERYAQVIYDRYRSSKEISKPMRDRFSKEDAERELVADFIARVCLGGRDSEMSYKALRELAADNRSWYQKLLDWVRGIIDKIGGDPHNLTLEKDLKYIEQRLTRVYDSAIKNTATENSGEKYSVARRSNSLYNQYNELVMQWAYSVGTHVGDLKTFNRNGKEFVLVESTEDGYIELLSGSYKEVKALEEQYREINDTDYSVYVCAATLRNEKAGNTADNSIIEDHGKYEDGSRQVGREGLQSDSARGNKYLRSSNKRESEQGNAGLDESAFSISTGTVHLEDVKKFAGKLLRQNRSGHDKARFSEQIVDILSATDNAEWGRAMSLATEAARDVINSSRNQMSLTDDAKELLDEIRSAAVSLNPAQRQEVAYYNGSYNNFRKHNMGRINLKNDGTPLDVKWQEWAEKYPHLFDADIPDVDMPSALASIVESLRSEYETYDTESAVSALAEQIFTEVVNTRGSKRTNYIDALADMQAKHETEIAGLTRRATQAEKRLARQDELLENSHDELLRAELEGRQDRRDRRKNIEYIRREVGKIDKKLRANSDKNPVPQHLQSAVEAFCNVFLQNDQSVFSKKDLALVYLAYSELAGDSQAGGEALLGSYDFDIDQQLKELISTLDGKSLSDLSLYELNIIRDVVDNIRHMITNENKLFLDGKSAEVAEVATKAAQELREHKTKKISVFTNKNGQSIFESNTTPIYFFDKLGPTFKKLFDEIRNGQDKWFRNMELAKTFIRQAKEKYHYSDWGNDTFKFKTVYGDELELTIEQAMLLYATAKREQTNTAQNAEHLFKGGVVLDYKDDMKTVLQKLSKAEDEGVGRVVNAFVRDVDAKAHQITPADVGVVSDWLTREQKAYADEMVKYLSNDMAALGNETSMQLFGIRKYNEDYYIPYNSAKNFLYSQPGVTNEQRLKHQSFTKQTQYKANNPLLLSDFSEVCADHINRMCMYNALTVPLENMNRVFNHSTPGTKDFSASSMKSEIERAFGQGATKYINQFLTDMNGNVRTSSVDSQISKWISRFKKGAVFASASVVVQQPSALARAFALVDPKYFANTAFSFSERDYQQLIKYAPIAGIKDMGRFDTGMGVENTRWLLQEKPQTLTNKIKEFMSVSDSMYRDDIMSAPAAKADEITWAHIWAAVKAETEATTELTPGTEEFLRYAGKRFRDVIDYTQVYDSTLSRSQNMRDKSAMAKMLTAFMAEPTVSLNLLMDATRKAKGGAEGKKYFARAVGAFVASVLLNSFLKSFVTAARDDDDDKSFAEKYAGDFVGNAASDIFIPNMIPFVKDIVSIFEGYSVERADMSLFSDLGDALNTFMSDDKSAGEKIKSLAGSLGAFAGLPVKNVLRDLSAAYNLARQFAVESNPTTAAGIGYSILEELPFGYDGKLSDLYSDLADAAADDNEKRYQKIYDQLREQGKTDSEILTGLESAYKKDRDVKKNTEKYLKRLSESKTFNALDADEQKKIGNSIASVLASEKAAKNTDRHFDKYDELYEAYRKNKTKYKRLRQQLLDDGATERQINEGFELARIAYLLSVGIDLDTYLLAKKVTSKDHADTDGSGGVSSKEKKAAIKNMDIDSKQKNLLIKELS